MWKKVFRCNICVNKTGKQDIHLSIMYTCRDAGSSIIAFRQFTCDMYARRFEAAALIPMSGYAIESPLHFIFHLSNSQLISLIGVI